MFLQLAIWGSVKRRTAYCKGSTGRGCTAMWQATARAAQNARSCPEEKSASTTGSTPCDFCTIRTYSYGHSGATTRSCHGNRYVLVVCDYATRYPEAMAMRSVEAEWVAEELVTSFERVGIPKEILTDQGTNFMSMLLQELYRLLHIRHICTSPYHP